MTDCDRCCANPDFRQARRPTRIYSGARTEEGCVVRVTDTAQPVGERGFHILDPEVSRQVADYCAVFDWGRSTSAGKQLALALLLDVTGEPDRAMRWCELFAERYVGNLSPEWTVPELDIELWLYCFENARPGA
jgi:hypothetical protein